jgi:hypothetical protein
MPLSTEVNGVHYRLTTTFRPGMAASPASSPTTATARSSSPCCHRGDYEMEPQPGWVLERHTDAGFEPLVAELTSPNPRPFQIVSEQTTIVALVLETAGVRLSLAPDLVQGVLEVRDGSIPAVE